MITLIYTFLKFFKFGNKCKLINHEKKTNNIDSGLSKSAHFYC